MNTEFLKEFVVLAETKNFWEASERLYMNQSTLSKHIKALESDLGFSLFTRTTRHVALTSYGQSFLPYAKAIVRTEFEGTAALQSLRNVENGLLTIGTMPSMSQYRITSLLANFQIQYPDTPVRITEDDPANLWKYLENANCEIIFTREDKQTFERNFIQDTQYRRIPYITDRLVALMQRSHPLAGEKSITLQQLSGESFCLIKEGSLMYQICTDACQQAGFIPNIIFTSYRTDSILDMVTNRSCVALLMDQHLMIPENREKRTYAPWITVPIQPAIQSQVSLCYRAGHPLSVAAQRFVDFCTAGLFTKKEHDPTHITDSL